MHKPDFQKLTPTTSVDLGIYQDAFEFIFKNDDIRNIAISGAYSSGKSSMLESLKIKFNNKKFINISLAHLKPHSKKETEQDNTFLEGKIINQLIHQIPSENIPQTNFSIKKNVTQCSIIKLTIQITIFILFSAQIFFFEKWKIFLSDIRPLLCDNLFTFLSGWPSLLISGSILSVLGFVFIYNFVSLLLNKKLFKKVKVQGTEIEIFAGSKDSYFDKYLNEVLYLFKNSGADIIAFEDIDRFDCHVIFERLREINFLINRSNTQCITRFIYLLRDDIFISKDRTKFFDFIIPTIPVLDGSNSIEEILRLFKSRNLNNEFNADFLQSLSLYIDDMRILKNVYNEFVVYDNKLNTIELDTNKLLAIITYKNLFPRDFSELQIGKGYIAAIFANKERFVQSEIDTTNTQVQELQGKLDLVVSEVAKDLQELDVLRQEKINKDYNNQRRITEEIDERKRICGEVRADTIEKLRATILELEKAIQTLHSKKLNEIVTRENIESLFDVTSTNKAGEKITFDEIKHDEYVPLLRYLIRNGYIDETYPDYLTFFYANSLSIEDKTFLRSISDKRPKPFSYCVRDAKKVLSRLTPRDFDQIETLNFDILCELLESSCYAEHLVGLISQLKKSKNYQFIIDFFETNRQQPAFVKVINANWPEFFSLMLNDVNFTEKFIKDYTLLTIYNSSEEDITKINKANILTSYISNNKTFSSIPEKSIKRLIHVYKLIGVSFAAIEYQESAKDLFFEVYNNSLYSITIDNITLILNKILGASENTINTKNFSLIFKEKESPLYHYVVDNLPIYLEALLNNYSSFYDDEIPYTFILNNDSISIKQKIRYIKKSNTKIPNITAIEKKNLWSTLLNSSSVLATTTNFLEYFSHTQQYDESLITFTNKNTFEIKLIDNSEDSLLDTLFDETVTCNELDNARYSQILSQLNYIYKSDPPKSIDQDKVDIVIDLKIFKMTSDMLLTVREVYPRNILKFIISNFSEYVKIFPSIPFNNQEFSQVLSSDLTDEQKLTILNLNSASVSAFGDNYSEEIVGHILQHNLDESEIQRILLSYAEHDSSVKNTVLNIALNKRHEIIDGSFQLPIELYNDIFKSDHIEGDIKIEFFIILLPDIDRDTCNLYLKFLQLPEFKKLLSKRSKRIKVNDINEKLLSVFKDKGWIKEFFLDVNDSSFYCVNS